MCFYGKNINSRAYYIIHFLFTSSSHNVPHACQVDAAPEREFLLRRNVLYDQRVSKFKIFSSWFFSTYAKKISWTEMLSPQTHEPLCTLHKQTEQWKETGFISTFKSHAMNYCGSPSKQTQDSSSQESSDVWPAEGLNLNHDSCIHAQIIGPGYFGSCIFKLKAAFLSHETT